MLPAATDYEPNVMGVSYSSSTDSEKCSVAGESRSDIEDEGEPITDSV